VPRESKAARAGRAERIYDLLSEEYPDAHCELDFTNPFQLAVATILSAQTTDVTVNMVTPALFERYPDAGALAGGRHE
jgi:endonuclease-3